MSGGENQGEATGPAPGGPPARPVLRSRFVVKIAAATAGVLLVLIASWASRLGAGGLVVYCAHDSVYSEKVLREFERRTGIRVAIRFDTEATKSLGLVQQIVREKDAPRCEVFWNNELLGTLDLAERGMLLPHEGPGHERIPGEFKDPGGLWAGFAARMRVWIVNTDRMAATEEAIRQRLSGDLGRVAIAKPLYGTTLTHYSVLWDARGADTLKAWHRDWRARGVREVAGNATVKNLVAEGVCDLGLTDTDDFFLAKDAGRPVAMVPFRIGSLGFVGGHKTYPPPAGRGTSDDGSRRISIVSPDKRVICIPNTVAIVKGVRHLEAARKLVDYLLSEEVELMLARSRSRQVPLGPVARDDLPPRGGLPAEVAELARLVGEGYPLAKLGPARAGVLAWLKTER